MSEIRHSAKGTTWGKHKYIAIRNGRYIYPGDEIPGSKNMSTPQNISRPASVGTSTHTIPTGAGNLGGHNAGNAPEFSQESSKNRQRPRSREKKIVDGKGEGMYRHGAARWEHGPLDENGKPTIVNAGRVGVNHKPLSMDPKHTERELMIADSIRNDEEAQKRLAEDRRKMQLIGLSEELEKKGYTTGTVEARLRQLVSDRQKEGKRKTDRYKKTNIKYNVGKAKVSAKNQIREGKKVANATTEKGKNIANAAKKKVSSAAKSASTSVKSAVNKGKSAVSGFLSRLKKKG